VSGEEWRDQANDERDRGRALMGGESFPMGPPEEPAGEPAGEPAASSTRPALSNALNIEGAIAFFKEDTARSRAASSTRPPAGRAPPGRGQGALHSAGGELDRAPAGSPGPAVLEANANPLRVVPQDNADQRRAMEILAAQRLAVTSGLRSNNGRPVDRVSNVVHILIHDPEFKDRIRWNELYLEPEWDGARGWEFIEDPIETEIAVNVEKLYNLKADHHIHKAIANVAYHNKYNPVRAYLERLTWDGEPRVERALVDLFGADPADELVEEKSRVFFLSAAARGLNPGCKVDTMLILQGGQGLRKSSALRALFSPDWFKDSDLPLYHSQDKYQALNGVWGYEIAEMASFSNRDWNGIKAFITAQADRFRSSYGKNNVTRQRTCVFAGTTNEQEFLRDATGSRRFPVVSLRGSTCLDGIEALRDQIWAEAVARIRAEENWWFDKTTEARVQAQNQRYLRADSWSDAIEEWLVDRVEPFSIAAVLGDAVGIKLDKQDSRHVNRAREILEAAGCVKMQRNGRDVRARDPWEHRIRGGSKRRLNPVRMWLAPAGQEGSQ
jgi:hypothetical protein